jgi:adenine-specific DNA-methyltransferase
MEDNNFSILSKNITKKLSKKEKKDQGIFFTPKSISLQLLSSLKTFIHPNQSYDIVEPSCGSGEIIDHTLDQMNVSSIVGIEKNKEIFDHIDKNKDHKIRWINQDFLNTNETPDIFIGNPPYVVMKKNHVPKEYQKFIEGRPNLFVLFILHSLHLLKSNGFLCFVIPTSFLNSRYYQKTRKYIYEKYTICDIFPFKQNDFLETQQSTIGLIIQKRSDDLNKNSLFTLNIDEQILFFDKDTKQKLEGLITNSTTIKNIGLHVKTGPIVWNENKESLIDKPTNSNDMVLIYNSNVKTSIFQIQSFKDKHKKQFIKYDTIRRGIPMNQPMIVVNRGNGNSKYVFYYCHLPSTLTIDNQEQKYVIENHLNMILGPEEKLQKVIESFKDPRTKEFIQLFSGNNGLSKSELENILPIYTI